MVFPALKTHSSYKLFFSHSHTPVHSLLLNTNPECWSDCCGRGDFSGDKHKVPGAETGHNTSESVRWRVCMRTWLQHCWLWCSWSPTSVREVRPAFTDIIQQSITTKCKHSDFILEMNMCYFLSNSTAEKINSIWLPAENKRKACIRVFSWRLQYRGHRGWRTARSGCRLCKFSIPVAKIAPENRFYCNSYSYYWLFGAR